MTVVRGSLNPGGAGWDGSLRLVVGLAGADPGFAGAGELISAEQAVPLDDEGAFEIELDGNSTITPAGTRWRFNIQPAAGYGTPHYVYVLVPATGGPYDIEDILSTEPADIVDPDTAALLSDRIGDLEALPVLPDPSAEPDDRWLTTEGGEWVATDAPAGGGGAVDSVNGQTGDVVLDAGDVGADPAGTASGLVTAEASTRSSADTALDGRLDTLEAISIATDAELASAVAAEATARDSAIATAVAAEATLARNGDNITSGTVADARIASTIARDSEVTAAIAALSTVYQPLDSDLTAIAALTTTSFGRSLLEAANASALRTLAGLVLGTDVYSKAAVDAGFQPLDADLTAIAAIATTAFGRSLLAAADTAAARTLTGAGPAPLFVRKTADESVTSSTTLQADDHLTKAVEASKTYFVRARIYYTASVAGDIKILWTAPAGATFEWDSVASPTFGVGGDTSALQSGSGLKRALGDTVSYGGVVTGAAINVEGFLTVAGTAGNFALTWAQNTSDGTATTVQAGSRILLQEVA